MEWFDRNPPNADQLYEWIVAKYGPDRFSREEITRWAMYSPDKNMEIYSIQERRSQDIGEQGMMRERVWDMLSWAGPSPKQKDLIEKAFVTAGGKYS